ncbi:TonB C-terminal domain-containing protein [Deltaproteobacteria bacterium TL4]
MENIAEYWSSVTISFILHCVLIGILASVGNVPPQPRVEYVELVTLPRQQLAKLFPQQHKEPVLLKAPVSIERSQPVVKVKPAPPEIPRQVVSKVTQTPLEAKKTPPVEEKWDPVPERESLFDILESTQNRDQTREATTVVGKRISQEMKGILSGLESGFSQSGSSQGETKSDISKLNTRGFSEEERFIYSQELRGMTEALWKVPPHLTETDLIVTVRFQVKKTGEIVKYEIEQLSGNEALDKSVKSLLKVLQRLPALPDSYPEGRVYEIGLRFNPKQFQF